MSNRNKIPKINHYDILYRSVGILKFKDNRCYTECLPSIVSHLIFCGDKCLVASVDANGHVWKDPIENIGVSVFKTKKSVERRLALEGENK